MSYGKVKETFWTDKKILSLSDDAKMLALYFLTGPHRNMLGCMRVPDGYLMADLGWSLERLSDAISMLCERHFICRDDEGWTIILNQLKHDPLKVPNHVTSAISIANAVPRDSIVFQELVPRLKANLNAIGKASSWHVDAIAIPEPEPEPEPAPEPAPDRAPAGELRKAIVQAFEAANSPNLPDTSRAELWLSQGYDAAIVAAVVKSVVARKPSITTLSYFDSAIREAHEQKRPPSAKPIEIDWPSIASNFARFGHWPGKLGPEPGYPGCRCPRDALEKHGIDPETGQKRSVAASA